MSTAYARYNGLTSGGGSGSGVMVYSTFGAFPAGGFVGELAVAADTGNLYEWNGSAWQLIGGPGAALSLGNLDAQAAGAKGAALTGGVLSMQSADAAHPGLVNNTTQSFSGNKTFTGSISASNLSGTNTGDVTLGTANGLSLVAQALSLQLSSTSATGALSSTDWNTFNNKQSTLTLGNLTSSDITVTGGTGAVVGSGTSLSIVKGNLTDAGTDGIVVTGGTGVVLGPGTSIAQHVADTTHNGYLSSTDWNTFNSKQAALTIGNLTDVGTDGIVITGGTGAVIGTGTSIAQHVADATHNGYLSSTDWSTFNSKQAAGNYITALTGDVTASGPGSSAATLATVNASPGSFGSASTSLSATVNGKGLITSLSSQSIAIAESQVTNLVSDLAAKQSTTLTSAHILVGNVSNVATDVAMTGDTTISNAGLVTIANSAVSNAKMANMAANTAKANITGSSAAPSDVSAVSTATVSSFMVRDSNANVAANSLISAYTSTATAAGTTALTVSSTQIQYFTGSSTQTVTLPDNTTLTGTGFQYEIRNNSSGVVTVNDHSNGLVKAMSGNSYAVFTATNVGSSAGTWDVVYYPANSSATVTTWASYTPTIGSGVGTVSANTAVWKQVGDTVYVKGGFTCGTVAASLVTISLPNSFTIDSTKCYLNSASNARSMQVGMATGNTISVQLPVLIASNTSTSLVYFGSLITQSTPLTPTNGSSSLSTGTVIDYQFEFPISSS